MHAAGPFFERMLRDSPEEEWKCFDVYREEYPSVEELGDFDAVVITGSKCVPTGRVAIRARLGSLYDVVSDTT